MRIFKSDSRVKGKGCEGTSEPDASVLSRRLHPSPFTLYAPQRGFSILEVLITAAIIGIITGIVTLRYGSFNNLILLKNQAYQIALDLRETQTRALSVSGTVQGVTSQFREPYGIHFANNNRSEYIIFRDIDSSGTFNTGDISLETRKLDSRFQIACVAGGGACSDTGAISITFRRPNFDALVNGASVSATVRIRSVTNADAVRNVQVNSAGQITVE